MLRCCYVTGHGLGGVGWDINVHVPCVHTWMLRCCYVTGHGLGGVGWDIYIYIWYKVVYHARFPPLVLCTGAPRIRATGALHCVQPTHKRGHKSILVTDGAPCYPKLTSEHSLLHEACNHSKGIFCITKKKEWGNLLVHTGGIDGMWKISKGAVSSSWSTRKDGVVNPQLLQGIRVWQWRWHHGNSTDFCSLTGKALSKRLEKWHATEEQGKRFQAATTTKPCKYHDIPSKSFNFDRQNLR